MKQVVQPLVADEYPYWCRLEEKHSQTLKKRYFVVVGLKEDDLMRPDAGSLIISFRSSDGRTYYYLPKTGKTVAITQGFKLCLAPNPPKEMTYKFSSWIEDAKPAERNGENVIKSYSNNAKKAFSKELRS